MADGVRVFRGVPFAEPPVGALRFRKPVKRKAWDGEREATTFAAAAMQANAKGISEDCLYLNVYAPTEAMGKGLPVLVWVHGGGFVGGRSSGEDGARFARDGVVCVTVAYRLGVLGFLDVSPLLGAEYAGSANNGLWDLVAALEWVRDNIAAFGGDPTKVTVGGQSAGAKLTDILLAAKPAQPLFQQAISESGGAERVWATKEAAADVAAGFAKVWGRDPRTLLTAPADELIAAQQTFMEQWPKHFPLRPQVDGNLLAALPVDLLPKAHLRGKRLLIGTNREESASFLGVHPAAVTARDVGNVSAEAFAPVEARYAGLYPEMTEEQRRIRATTAEEYWVPSIRVADAAAKGSVKVWLYEMEFTEGSGTQGAFAHHSEELDMVWNHPQKEIAHAAGEAKLAAAMHGAWVAFLKGDAPKGPGMPVWPEYTSNERATMIFDEEMRVETKPQEAELRLWDGVE